VLQLLVPPAPIAPAMELDAMSDIQEMLVVGGVWMWIV
jgi:hypothetical protein